MRRRVASGGAAPGGGPGGCDLARRRSAPRSQAARSTPARSRRARYDGESCVHVLELPGRRERATGQPVALPRAISWRTRDSDVPMARAMSAFDTPSALAAMRARRNDSRASLAAFSHLATVARARPTAARRWDRGSRGIVVTPFVVVGLVVGPDLARLDVLAFAAHGAT